MRRTRRKKDSYGFDDALRVAVRGKRVPHEFVLDAIATLSPRTRPMFGCVAVYVGEKIVLILRDKPGAGADSGVWLATPAADHRSLRRQVLQTPPIGVPRPAVT